MKIFKFTALTLAAVLALTPAVGCKHDIKSSSALTRTEENVGGTVISAEVSKEVIANETNFTLNRVIDAGAVADNGDHYIYLDITIRNDTATEYTLSTLNNFYITLPDETRLSSDVRPQIYAAGNFSDKFVKSPFNVPANSTFTGIIGGFLVPDGKTDFTVGFFPTRDNDTDKDSVIKVQVTAGDIVQVPDDLKK